MLQKILYKSYYEYLIKNAIYYVTNFLKIRLIINIFSINLFTKIIFLYFLKITE